MTHTIRDDIGRDSATVPDERARWDDNKATRFGLCRDGLQSDLDDNGARILARDGEKRGVMGICGAGGIA